MPCPLCLVPVIREKRGAALLLTFIMMLVLAVLALAVGTFAHNGLVQGKTYLLDQQAAYVAEAGLQRARQALVAGTWSAAADPGNTYTESFGAGEYRVTIIDEGGSVYTITSEGYVPSQSAAQARRQVVEDDIVVTSSDGTNYSLTAAATASSSNGAQLPALAQDGLDGTYWEAGTNGSGQWLNMDYSASPPTLTKIVVYEHNRIDGVTLEYSDDNSSWTVPGGISIVESPSKVWTATFTATSHQYFRATFTASSSGHKVSVDEMEAYNSTISSLGNGEVSTAW